MSSTKKKKSSKRKADMNVETVTLVKSRRGRLHKKIDFFEDVGSDSETESWNAVKDGSRHDGSAHGLAGQGQKKNDADCGEEGGGSLDEELKHKISKDQEKQDDNEEEKEKGGEKKKVLSCPHCPQKFSFFPAFRAHVTYHSSENPFKCPERDCPCAFKTATALNGHSVVHSRMFVSHHPFKCELCPVSFKEDRILKLHVDLVHRDAKAEFSCPYCTDSFMLPSQLSQHLNGAHEDLKRANKCLKCECTFVDQEHLDKHALLHHRVNLYEFPCKLCNSDFPSKNSLDRHMKVHLDDYKVCPHCPAKFLGRGPLRRHISNMHFGSKEVDLTNSSQSVDGEAKIETAVEEDGSK